LQSPLVSQRAAKKNKYTSTTIIKVVKKMATHNPKEARLACRPTLNYIYRGEGHEHTVSLVKHLGGNLFAQNPIKLDAIGNLLDIELDAMEKGFNSQAQLHRGKGEKLFKHYVISLAPGEELTAPQWLEFINAYMKDLGYDSSTKWVAVQHSDSACQHVHILSCLVRNDIGGTLVKTGNDYAAGWASMRKYEEKFGLQQLVNPDQGFGHNYTKGELKGFGSRANAVKHDDAAIIRARFKSLFESRKPSIMTELVEGLSKRGVHVKLSLKEDGGIQGINYSLDGHKWISGTKVKKSRLTWQALQQKEGINYNPARDNAALGLGSQEIEFEITLRLREQHFTYFMKQMNFIISKRREEEWLNLRFRARNENFQKAVILLLLMMLSLIFGINLFKEPEKLEELIDDVELTIEPTREIDFEETNNIQNLESFTIKITTLFQRLFNPTDAPVPEATAVM
jgi:hypothetical protein